MLHQLIITKCPGFATQLLSLRALYDISCLVRLNRLTMDCTAGDLEHSERDILNLRSQQNRFAERIALMQRLLKVNMVSSDLELIRCDSTCFSCVTATMQHKDPHMRSESWSKCQSHSCTDIALSVLWYFAIDICVKQTVLCHHSIQLSGSLLRPLPARLSSNSRIHA